MIKSSDTSSSFRLDINKHYCCTSEHQLSCRTRTHKREKMSALSLLFGRPFSLFAKQHHHVRRRRREEKGQDSEEEEGEGDEKNFRE